MDADHDYPQHRPDEVHGYQQLQQGGGHECLLRRQDAERVPHQA